MMNDFDDHESRIRAVERKQDAHEALCSERYGHILTNSKTLEDSVKLLQISLQKRIDYLIIGIVMLAFIMAVGPDIAERVLGKIIH